MSDEKNSSKLIKKPNLSASYIISKVIPSFITFKTPIENSFLGCLFLGLYNKNCPPVGILP
jgi:hypothetical protein